jgi:phospholipase D1/2
MDTNDLFEENVHYTARARANALGFLLDSAAYYAALADVIPRARRRVLIVGWCFDDRIRLVRGGGDPGAGVGDMLISAARDNPTLSVQLVLWKAPPFFSGDQHISAGFMQAVESLPNLTIQYAESESAFGSVHEKYVIIDDVLAFLGGMDISLNRWDTPDHRTPNCNRVNPEGVAYNPYHDTQVAMTGPVVQDLFEIAQRTVSVDRRWNPADTHLWPAQVAVDLENAEVLISLTRSHTDPHVEDTHQIKAVYMKVIRSAQEFIYIENQYFSDEDVTEELVRQLSRPDGPEVVIVMARELPDALGRWTMGVSASMHLHRLMQADRYDRLGFYNLFSPDDPSIDVKVHSKMMIVDGRIVTLGSANINRRSFKFDSELNVTIDARQTDDPRCIRRLEESILARHCGLTVDRWRELLRRNGGSRRAALRERAETWIGMEEGNSFLDPASIPGEMVEYADMERAPEPETVFHTLARQNPREFIRRTKRVWILVLLAAGLLGAIFYVAQSDIDVDRVLRSIEEINATRPVLAGLLSILAYWLAMTLFVTIVVPIVFFAALHGPWWGMLYSVLGLFSGATIFYAVGLVLHNGERINRYRVIRNTRKQLEEIKPHGTWAVAVSRMVPSGPFLVVNLVTGLLRFSPRQFLAGSIMGLMPGIVAFSFFGEIIRNVFTDPGWFNTTLFLLFVGLYMLFVRVILAAVRRVAG